MGISSNITNWLASGERGVSSNTIVQHLTGLKCERFMTSHPHDPGDLMRCRQLLKACPELVPELPRMASLSREWAALVASWGDLCETLDREIPGCMEGAHGMAPRTYEMMRGLIAGSQGTNGEG